jgi:aspartate carbamoyltransferase regulatory subunit
MTCPIHVGNEFRWTESYKDARHGDLVRIDDIYVDEDGVPQVTVQQTDASRELITASDIHEKVESGLLEKLE